MKTETTISIPLYFKPILWSYDFKKLDLQKNKREIVLNTINYGNLIHWCWIVQNYGRKEVWQIIKQSRPTELRLGARRLAAVVIGQNYGK